MNSLRVTKRTPQPSTVEAKSFAQKSGEIQYQRRSVETAGGPGILTGGYRRWLEFDEVDHPGQDFAGYRVDRDHVVGVVVDGVSQSFHGQIAAQRVGDHLLDVLWRNRSRPPGPAELKQGLRQLADFVQKELEEKSLPDKALLRQALEEARKYGSQAVFSAFILDTKALRADLYQVGDTVSWVFRGSGGPEAVDSNPRGRWSSVGRVSAVEHDCFQDVRGVLLHSDGMARATAEGLGEAEIAEESFLRQAEGRAAQDDVSFIAFALEPGATTEGGGRGPASGEPSGRSVPGTAIAAVLTAFLLGLGGGAALADLMGMNFLGKEPGAAQAENGPGDTYSGPDPNEVQAAAAAPQVDGPLEVGSSARDPETAGGLVTPQSAEDKPEGNDQAKPPGALQIGVERSREDKFTTEYDDRYLPQLFLRQAKKKSPGQIVARIACDAELFPCALQVTVDGRLPEQVYRIEGSGGLSEAVVYFVLLPGLSKVESGYDRLPRQVEIQVTGGGGTWKAETTLDGRELKDQLDPKVLTRRDSPEPFFGYHLLTLAPDDSGS